MAHDRVLALRPDLAEAWLGRGNLLTALERYDAAAAAYERALALKADLAEAWLGRGNLLVKLDRHDAAAAAYERALALKPGLLEAWLSLGNTLAELKRFDEALAACDKALALRPDLAEAWLGRNNAYFKLGRYEDALAASDKALALKPDLAAAWLGRGDALFKLERHGEALIAYDRALVAGPDLAEAWLGRGNVLTELQRDDEALVACDKALALKPDLAEAWLGRGNADAKLNHPNEAVSAYRKALARKPDLAEAWLGCGNAYSELARHDEALAAYDRALALKPDLVRAWLGRGNLLTSMERHDEALAAYERGLALEPDGVGLQGLRLRSKQNLCNWDDFESECSHLIESVAHDELVTDPFAFLSLASRSEDQHICAKRWTRRYQQAREPVWNGEVYKHDRVRIGYVSADFQEHATAYLMAGVFDSHRRSLFDVTAISIGPSDSSPMRRRLESAFEHFLDAGRLSDAEVAAKIAAAEIDILVDLKGFTKSARTNIFTRRAAPIQVNYLGYPGTMGADYIDYIIADPTVIPPAAQRDYSEKVVYLPDCYQPNDSRRRVAETTPTRAQCGLPEQGFVFCCFNNNYKITPDVFDVWMRILRKVPGSVLWLFESNAAAPANLKQEAERRGVDAARIVFARSVPLPDHLARHRLADLFLDTLPYNAHTTASDALWAGLPVLTRIGETFAGRVAASLLKAIGLPELITDSPERYEGLAIEIAQRPEILQALKTKLADNRLRAPLFDTKRFTEQIEAAYLAMHERFQAGLAPDTIVAEDRAKA
ncbi:tetratricopeptide repeat protein [Bradyrhizobium macuxiense]|uniref:tetratricopeptide repeat protein n=1 Tax=Bradyrhizobium macuxiense TaxID=1755647 RepID=UPI001FEE6C41|nr:glycosyltransferase family 41 protein [Bradyrhizobium macuxiense]